MTRLSLLSPSDYQRTRWKNDGGWTTEIARSADDSPCGFRWRISIAEIERDGPFSSFPGVARDLLLLEGNGIELDIDDAAPHRMTQRFERVRFNGESSVNCRLLAGPTRDFNVMTRRDAVDAEVIARPLVGPMVIFPETDCEWFMHLFGGRANARSGEQSLPLTAGASLLADFRDGAGERIVIEGSGAIVLVKLAATATAIDR